MEAYVRQIQMKNKAQLKLLTKWAAVSITCRLSVKTEGISTDMMQIIQKLHANAEIID